MSASKVRIFAFLGAIFANGSLAQEVPDGFLACAALNDDADRLSCFDREMTRQPLTSRDQVPTTDSSVTTVITPEQKPPAADVMVVPIPQASMPTPSAPAADVTSAMAGPAETPNPAPLPDKAAAAGAATTATPPQVSTVDNFGMAGERAAVAETPEASAPEEPEQIVAKVTDVDRQPHGEYIVALNNGQIWAEEFASRYFPVEVGDTVTIKKRMFSGYRLVTESGKGFRVKRMR